MQVIAIVIDEKNDIHIVSPFDLETTKQHLEFSGQIVDTEIEKQSTPVVEPEVVTE